MNEFLLVRNEHMTYRPILYVDQDGPLADYDCKVVGCDTEEERDAIAHRDGFFMGLPPTKNSLEAMEWLKTHFELFILTTSPWKFPRAAMEKILWVQKYYPSMLEKRVIISHFKNLSIGDFLIDDRSKNGAAQFSGEWIQFGSPKYLDWQSIVNYLASRINVAPIVLDKK